MPEKPALVLVPTPLGNLQDITLRAIEALKNADFLLCEDTRVTGKLLKHLQIEQKLHSFHAHNEHGKVERILERLRGGEQAALVSDAGTPAISDPGFLLVRACHQAGLAVEALPGPTALVPALVASGLPADRFVFEGFLPHKKGRQTRLAFLAEEERTMIFYESPFRLLKTLQNFREFFGGERPAAVCRELSKLHEEIVRGTLQELIAHFAEQSIKGEIVLVVRGHAV